MNPDRFAFLRRSLSARLVVALTQMFNGLGSWHRPDAQRFATAAVPMVEGAQSALANLTSNYVASVASEALRRPVAPPPIPQAARARLRLVDPGEVYQRPFVEAYTALKDGQQLDQALNKARVRLREVAEGDMQLAYAHSAQAAMQGLPEQLRPTGWRRVLVGSENCAMCVLASTQRYHREDLNPIHPSCVPAGTRVATTGLMAVTRRSYTGELVIITTADADDELAITPNHPILTDQGWLPGHLVGEGDHIIRSRDGHRAVGGAPHERHRPALIEDVWRAVSMAGFIAVPLTAEDFHGDGANGEVDIVWTDGHLTTVSDLTVVQELRKHGLVSGQRLGHQLPALSHLTTLVPTATSATNSVMRSSGLGGALSGSHLCRSHKASVRTSTAVDTGFGKPPLHNGSRYPEALSDNMLGDATTDVVERQLLRRVTHVRRIDFTGHVYDLQTRLAWYEANGYIIHNCDCTVEPIYGPFGHDRVIEPQLLEQVHAAVLDLTGVVDRGGRAVDYRHIMTQIVHTHGELGNVLARPGDRFTGPTSIPA